MYAVTSFLWVKTEKAANDTVWIPLQQCCKSCFHAWIWGCPQQPSSLQGRQGSAMGSPIMTQTPQTNGIRQQFMHWLIQQYCSRVLILGHCLVIGGDLLWVTTLVIWQCRWKCQRYLWGAMKYLDDQPNWLADLWSVCTLAILSTACANTFWFLATIWFHETTTFLLH